MRALQVRPLAVAGAAAVAGVLPATGTARDLVLALALLAAGALCARFLPRAAGLCGVCTAAALAGLAAGHRSHAGLQERLRTLHALRARTAAVQPVEFELSVAETGEDPFRARAWLYGSDTRGTPFLCSWSGACPDGVRVGSRVRIAGRLYIPAARGNPGERDAAQGLAARGAVGVVDLGRAANLVVLQTGAATPWFHLRRLRRRIGQRILRTLPSDVAPLVAALLLGYRSGVSPEDRQSFERTGTLHLLAISGLHVLILAAGVHRLLRVLGAGPRSAAAVTLLLAVLYAPLAGAGPPIRRAVGVLAFYALALALGRAPDVASALGGTALVLVLADPAGVHRIGFQLSFAAVAGIAWLARPWTERATRRHRLLARFPAVRADHPLRLRVSGYLLRAFPAALAAWLSTAGLVAHAFGLVAPVAVAVNVAVGPLVALLLPANAALAAGLNAAAPVCTLLVRCLRSFLKLAAVLPCVRVVPPTGVVVAVWMTGVAALRRRALCGVVLMACSTGAALLPRAPPTPGLVLLNVGHGQAALLRFPGGDAVLVDAGSRTTPKSGRRIVRPALQALGVTRLRAVVCTHRDADHWNALPEILASFPVDRVWCGGDPPAALRRAAARRGIPLGRARPGQVLHETQGARLEVIAAATPGLRSSNDRSLVLRFSLRGRVFLLPADREERGLRALLAGGAARCDVLLAPHHGAACAAAAEVGRVFAPRLLLVSGARSSSDAAALRAYATSEPWTTWSDGCIEVSVSRNGSLTVRGWRSGRVRVCAPPR
ncbi:MAG: ComEC/Rec2 family competence protein [Planctomycetota bacterium]